MEIRLDSDFLYVACMTWSKSDVKGKGPVLKKGMIICYLDPREWKDGILLKEYSQRAFAWFQLNRSLKADLIDGCKPEQTRARKGYFDFNELESKLGKPNLKKDFENQDKIVSPVKGILIGTADFKLSKEHTWQ